ncbi:MAG TPA: NAD(P)/FAD-dependent oxidoreductase [Candidatus Absconditabacterales bacterium]|nr:NAD(P)/FAD-dependent oxidoreductase [Candidatus Absconditabacterales bacterium]HNG97551.1 NAD(P)/FAD-dependent oxidoreductase [Candidatus Absconditabacterales bacterium]
MIIIVGAGPAGLTAGLELIKAGYQVVILEMSGTLGGIAQTVNYKNNRIDIGGHRFFSKSDEVMKRWFDRMPMQGTPATDYKQLKIDIEVDSNGPDPDLTDRVMLKRNRLSRLFFRQSFFDYPPTLKWTNLKNLGLWNVFQIITSYISSKFQRHDLSHLEGFYIKQFGRKLYELFFKNYTRKLRGKDPTKIDSARGAQRVKGVSISELIKTMRQKLWGSNTKDNKQTQTSLINQFWYPKFGPGHMRETVASEFIALGGSILYHHKVIKFVQKNDGTISQVVAWHNDQEIVLDCDKVLSTMPMKYLFRGLDRAPGELKQLAEKLEYRDFITVGILLKKLIITNTTSIPTINGIIPDNRIYIHEPQADFLRIQIFNNRSPYMVADVNTVWVGLEYMCDKGDQLWSKSDEQLQKEGLDQLEQIGIAHHDDFLDSTIIRVEKAYPGYFGEGYASFDKLKTYTNNISNLYCIGRNGMHRYNNQDHSVLCALKCVEGIVTGVDNRDLLWEINTEQEYHEKKKEEDKRGK